MTARSFQPDLSYLHDHIHWLYDQLIAATLANDWDRADRVAREMEIITECLQRYRQDPQGFQPE